MRGVNGMENRKWFCTLVAFNLLGALALSGCGSDDASPSPTAGGQSAKPSAAATAGSGSASNLEFVTLKMYYPSGGVGGKDDGAVQEAVNKYLKEKLNANLQLNAIPWASWSQKMPLVFQTGEQADLVWTGGATFYADVAKKAYQPLEELLDKYGQDLKKTIDPDFLKAPVVNGKLYAIPTNKEKVYQNAMFLRKDLVEKYKIDTKSVKTLADLAPLFEKVKSEPGITPAFKPQDFIKYFPTASDNPDLVELPELPYAMFNKKTGEVVNAFAQPQTLKKYEIAREWYQAGYANKDAATNQDDAWSTIKNGKSWIGFGSAKPGSASIISQAVAHEMAAVPIKQPIIDSATLTGSMLGIPTASKDPARAMMVLNLLHTDPYLENLIVFGIEGRQYEKVSGTIIKLPQGAAAPSDTGYAPGINWEIGNQYIQYLYNTENPNQWEEYKAWGKEGKASFLLGFTFDPSPVKNEVAALDNVRLTTENLLTTGSVDTQSSYQKFLKDLQDKKIDTVLKEVKTQIDAWMKTNGKKLEQ